MGRRTVTVFYHYLYPDDVVSARIFSDLCEGLYARGWDVCARPCNRGWQDDNITFLKTEIWKGTQISRIWRPGFRQSLTLGRFFNALWMVVAWSCQAFTTARKTDVVIVGTDPIFSVLIAIIWKIVHPKVKIVHWCFDLYPEAAVAEGLVKHDSCIVRMSRWMLKTAYRSCNLIIDIGTCMRRLLDRYDHKAQSCTFVPWALIEPAEPLKPDLSTRRALFGHSRLGIIYSGSFGRAHAHQDMLRLARMLHQEDIHFSFGVRGNRVEELKKAVKEDDTNVSFAGFASESELEKRLSAADICFVSLRPEWTGTVIPSKFFGCLAAGRPVIFSGDRESAIARWIDTYKVGWVLDQDSINNISKELIDLSKSERKLIEMQQRCHHTYAKHFSKKHTLDQWDSALHNLLDRPPEDG